MGINVPFWSPKIGDQNLTAALIAAILGSGSVGPITDTAITTVGNGTLTAAGLIGGQIVRTGPTGVYTDATDTAANIVTALGGFVSGQTFFARIKNATTFAQTISAGTGVTLPPSVVVPPLAVGNYYGTVGGTAASPTVTFTHLSTLPVRVAAAVSNPQASPLTTVGAGTILAASINAGVTTRGGTQTAAFADTLDSAANIIAGVSALISPVGTSVRWKYVNNTTWPATITSPGGTVTITGAAVVPANSWVEYLVTVSGAGNVTFLCIGQGYFQSTGTVTVNGASSVVVSNAAITKTSVVSFGLNTVGGTPAAAPYMFAATPGTSFTVRAGAGDTSTYSYEIRG